MKEFSADVIFGEESKEALDSLAKSNGWICIATPRQRFQYRRVDKHIWLNRDCWTIADFDDGLFINHVYIKVLTEEHFK